MNLICCLMLLWALFCGAEADCDNSYFTAAVYEHAILGDESRDAPSTIVQMNLNIYSKAAQVAKSQGADIIVFPEYGLFVADSRKAVKPYLEYIPDPRLNTSNPCRDRDSFIDRPILLALSCMAQQNGIVVVANMGDIQPCVKDENSTCHEDGVLHLNTNVAFDKDGSLLARYYKEHLYFEYSMDLPLEKQDSTFKTDFGTFAMFICFDIVFRSMRDAAQNENVDAILFSALWIDPPPTMTSVQYWQSWAMGNNATLLAANIQLPGYRSFGSGIFKGREGALARSHKPDGESKLVIARVPKCRGQLAFPGANPRVIKITDSNNTSSHNDDRESVRDRCSSSLGSPNHPNYRCREDDMTDYNLVQLKAPKGAIRACNNGMCCSLNYSTKGLKETFYFGVLNGTYTMSGRYTFCIENCILVRCNPKGGKPCVIFPMRSKTRFYFMRMTANFTTQFVYPSVMYSRMRLAPVKDWTYDVISNNHTESFLEFKSEIAKPLLMAALNGRCYDRDPPYRR